MNAFKRGPHFTFSEAISLVVHGATQQEIEDDSRRLTAGGQQMQCGWVKEQYGLSWQIVPEALLEMATDSDPNTVTRVIAAMMTMKTLDIAALKRAYQEA